MKRTLCLLFLSLLFFVVAFLAQAEVSHAAGWVKRYGNGGESGIYSIRRVADGYIAAGKASAAGSGRSDAWVIKLDALGAVQWQRSFGGTPYQYATEIQQTSDAGYIVAGVNDPDGRLVYDAWLFKLDLDGTVEWSKTYGAGDRDVFQSVKQTRDGGYVAAGATQSFGVGDSDAWVVKLNQKGDIVWQKTFGGNLYDGANYIEQTSDGGYIVACDTRSFGQLDSTAWVLKLNSTGDIQWQKLFGSEREYEEITSIRQTTDGGYVFGGQTSASGAGGGDAFVVKLDAKGEVKWEKAYVGRWFNGGGVIQASDGGYVIFGSTSTAMPDIGYSDLWLAKLDPEGNILWQNTYGTDGSVYAIDQAADGGYILGGVIGAVGGNILSGLAGPAAPPAFPLRYDALVIKTESRGNVDACDRVVGSGTLVASDIAMPVGVPSPASGTSTVVPRPFSPLIAMQGGSGIDVCSVPVRSCAATVSIDLRLHIPVIAFEGKYYRADFAYVPGTSDIVLTGASPVTDIAPFSGCSFSSLTSDLRLFIPEILFGGNSFRVEFRHTGGLTMTLTGAGQN